MRVRIDMLIPFSCTPADDLYVPKQAFVIESVEHSLARQSPWLPGFSYSRPVLSNSDLIRCTSDIPTLIADELLWG